MPLQLLKYNAGIVKDTTEYSAGKNGPFYVDCDLVRFKNGYAEKIGGWQKEQINELDASGNITGTETTLTGIGRKMIFWRAFVVIAQTPQPQPQRHWTIAKLQLI